MGEMKDRPIMTVGEVVDLAGRGTIEISRSAGLQPVVLVTMLMTPTDTSVGIVCSPEVKSVLDTESLADCITKVLFEHTKDLFAPRSEGERPS
jgi:hypothetical protein